MRPPILLGILAVSTACASNHSPPATGFAVTLESLEPEFRNGDIFQLTFTSTPRPVAQNEIEIGLSAPDQTEMLLPWDLFRDLNANDMIDAGDAIVVVAPVAEAVEMIESNSQLDVTVLLSVDNGHRQVWSGIWLRKQ